MTVPTPANRAEHARTLLVSGHVAWLTSATAEGAAHLIPLSYYWDGRGMVFSTIDPSITLRNLRRRPFTRAALPSTDDVVIVDGEVEFLDSAESAAIEGFAAWVNWDPRNEPQPYVYFRLRPVRVQAWKGPEDLPTRDVMRDGRWIDGGEAGPTS